MEEKTLEDLRAKLRGWPVEIQGVVAARMSLRVFPCLGSHGHFKYWNKEIVGRSVREILNASLTALVVKVLTTKVGSTEAFRRTAADAAYAADRAAPAVSTTVDTATLAALKVANAAAYVGVDVNSAAASAVDAAAYAYAHSLVHDNPNAAAMMQLNFAFSDLSKLDKHQNIISLATMPLYSGAAKQNPRSWQVIESNFKKACHESDLKDTYRRYQKLRDKGLDLNECQKWIFGKIIFDFVEHQLDFETVRKQIRSPEWLGETLYWMALQDRVHLDLLESPSVEKLRAWAKTKPLVGLVQQRKLAQAEFGEFSPPPLWQAWYKECVHPGFLAELLREIPS